jgi:hypothetical protein
MCHAASQAQVPFRIQQTATALVALCLANGWSIWCRLTLYARLVNACAGHADEDQQQVWRDIAAAMQDAVQQLEPQVPPNPNQVEERADVRDWEERYQERLRQRRLQQLPEAVLTQQHAAVGAAAGDRSSSNSSSSWQDQQQQQQQQEGGKIVLQPSWQQSDSEESEEQLTIASISSNAVVQLSRRQQRQGSEWVWWRLLTAGFGQQQLQQQPSGQQQKQAD